ncbi:MAG: outer membrane beta-barrel protein, partial [Bdellovibrionota bacterium]
YGVGVGWSAMPGFGFETDLLMTKRKFGANAVTDLAAQYLQIPVIFKATMIPMVTLGAGLYYAKSLSDKLTQTTSGVDTEISFGSLNWNQSDFGWLLEAGGSFPLAPLLSFKVDLRYYMGFSSISTDTTRSDKWNGLDVLAGLSFGF